MIFDLVTFNPKPVHWEVFPTAQVIDLVVENTHDSDPLNLNLVGRPDLSSSWVWEKPADQSTGKKEANQVYGWGRCNIVSRILWSHSYLVN